MKQGRTGLVRAVVSGSIILLAVISAHGRNDTRDNRPIPGPKPASPNVANAMPSQTGGMLQLDLVCDTASGSRLLRLLASDRIKVVWVDTGSGGEMTIRVKMTVSRFKAFFKGELVKRKVARSSCDGFATEQFIERYVIPKKYTGLLLWVRLPDPQID